MQRRLQHGYLQRVLPAFYLIILEWREGTVNQNRMDTARLNSCNDDGTVKSNFEAKSVCSWWEESEMGVVTRDTTR